MAVFTQGTIVTFEDAVPVAQTVACVSNLVYAGGAATVIDNTKFSSTSIEKLPGLNDNGAGTMDLIADFDDVGYLALKTSKEASGTREMVVTRPSGSSNIDTFQAFVTSIERNGSVNDKWLFSITFEITGDIVTT